MILFCNGKQDICEEKDCEKTCPFHDGSGGKYMKTIFEVIKGMSEEELALLFLPCIDAFEEYICDGQGGCFDENNEPACSDEKRIACIIRWLHSPEGPRKLHPLKEGERNKLRSEIPRGKVGLS